MSLTNELRQALRGAAVRRGSGDQRDVLGVTRAARRSNAELLDALDRGALDGRVVPLSYVDESGAGHLIAICGVNCADDGSVCG